MWLQDELLQERPPGGDGAGKEQREGSSMVQIFYAKARAVLGKPGCGLPSERLKSEAGCGGGGEE